MSAEQYLLIAIAIVPLVANVSILLLRHYGLHAVADFVRDKAPLVLEVLSSNRPKERAMDLLVDEARRVIVNPELPAEAAGPLSVAVKGVLETSK